MFIYICQAPPHFQFAKNLLNNLSSERVFLVIYLSIYPSIYLSYLSHLSYLSIYLIYLIYLSIYLSIYLFIYLSICLSIYPVNVIVRIPHPRSRDSQGQETFLACSADKQTRNFDTRMLKPLSLLINPKVKGIEP